MLSPLVKGALLLLLAEACFAGIGAIVKFTSGTASEVQVVFFRNFFALLLMLPFLYKHGFGLLKTKRWYLHLSRALTGIISMYCFFYVLARLPLAQGMLVLLLSPFIVPVIARFWLKERPSRLTLFSILLGFVGVLLALPANYGSAEAVLLVGLLSAVLVAVTKTTIRYMSDTEPAVRIVFYFSLLTALLSAIPVPFYWQPLNNDVWLAFIGMGVLAATGQLAMTRAYAVAPASDIGMWTYSSVIFAGLFGYLFWQEPVSAAWFGGVLVIFYAGYITTRQRLF
ncbi:MULTISPECIES: DMT family transporter [Rheinheimera]|jgi:drug/metabolite transporter (DMT)-like permease|uniref:DMT family transporter n=1 Tax=Rheinheimera TaxID=67575 RepID=UPI000E8D43CE|nr:MULTISPECIES: DMT family transporter [Rheinheimera]MCD1598747.1 DMT family transporter [Rheinheimera aquimaris]HBN88291.1 multidrug DMT transporter permease [Rheinheimera sp.]|tara:strand:- start:4250 stop:5098 length:849 start_codon:yes stop_codon:yes gene_type:complete